MLEGLHEAKHRRLMTLAEQFFVALAGTVAGLLLAGPVVAHGPGLPTVIVPLDHVVPGVVFETLLSDFEAGATIHITIIQGGKATELAAAITGPDGHGSATARLPAGFPFGYVELIAASSDGASAQTWIRVGDATYTSPGSVADGEWWTDPAVLVIGAIILGATAALVHLVRRRRRRMAQ